MIKNSGDNVTHILIDTANTFFRARHVIRGDTSEKIGMAIHIMMNSIKKAWQDFDGTHLVFCLEGRSWRKDHYAPYKRNRKDAVDAMTQQEKEAIDNDPIAKSAYGISIKYGTNPEKPYWYMCPRYWCLNTNKPMTEEQVKNGECGGKIIPSKLKTKIPEGHYIYEFTDDRQHKDVDGNYLYYNPGFLDKSKSSENVGIPCCFRNPFSAKQNTRRQELNISEDDITYGDEALISGEKTDKVRSEHTYKNVLSS